MCGRAPPAPGGRSKRNSPYRPAVRLPGATRPTSVDPSSNVSAVPAPTSVALASAWGWTPPAPWTKNDMAPGSRAGSGDVLGSGRLDDEGGALAHADAHRRHPPAPAPPPQLVDQRGEDAGAGRPDGMAEGDGAAVGVDDGAVELGPAGEARQRLGGERLVQLHHVEVAPADPCPSQSGGGGLDRPDAVEVGIDGRHRPGGDA